MDSVSSPLCERAEPLAEQQPLPKPFKIDDLPQDIQDFINKHGGIGLLVEKCTELNPQWVDSAMAWVFIIQWAREELRQQADLSATKALAKGEELKSQGIIKEDDIQT